jgi:squalene-hopene/tetraprenyl-beta-curcumene cyclase
VDGSWGGEFGVPGTIEESSLAISALIGRSPSAILNGFAWLERETTQHGVQSSPIGLYFAMLWYDEKLYPLIFYFEALRRYLKPAQALVIAPDEPPRSTGEESGH